MKLARSLAHAARFAVFSVVTSVATSAHAVVQPETGVSFPRDVSRHGHLIDWLLNITGVFVALLFLVMCIWIFWACIKHGKNHAALYEHGDTRSNVHVALALSAIVFFIVDGNLFYHSFRDTAEVFWNFKGADAAPNVLRVEVNAHQWAWDFRLAGPDDEFNTADDIVTLNDMRIPVNRPILLQVAATDVLHSIYFPNLRLKTDAVPGTINPLWFEAIETGEFDIGCAQHCGMAHYLMKGKLTILPEREYEAWAAHASKVGELSYDAQDVDAHWGWPWQEM